MSKQFSAAANIRQINATEKHAFLRIKDVPTVHSTGVGIAQTDRIPSSLDMALRRLADKSVKVLDFWRTRIGWTIKVMVPHGK